MHIENALGNIEIWCSDVFRRSPHQDLSSKPPRTERFGVRLAGWEAEARPETSEARPKTCVISPPLRNYTHKGWDTTMTTTTDYFYYYDCYDYDYDCCYYYYSSYSSSSSFSCCCCYGSQLPAVIDLLGPVPNGFNPHKY